MDCSHGQGEEDTREQEGPGWGGIYCLWGAASEGHWQVRPACSSPPASQQVFRDGLLAAVLQGRQLAQSSARPLRSRVAGRRCEGGMR